MRTWALGLVLCPTPMLVSRYKIQTERVIQMFAQDLTPGQFYLGFRVLAVSAPVNYGRGLVVKVTVERSANGAPEDFFPAALALV